jgi:hypothetical protein
MAKKVSVRPACQRCEPLDQRLGADQTVDRGGNDSSGIAGPFSDWIQAGYPWTFPGPRVTVQSDGRTAPHFGANQYRVLQETSVPFPIHYRKAGTNRLGNCGWDDLL